MRPGPECETLNQIVNPPCIVILVNAPSLGRGVLPSHICPGETLHFRQGCRIRGSRPGFLSLTGPRQSSCFCILVTKLNQYLISETIPIACAFHVPSLGPTTDHFRYPHIPYPLLDIFVHSRYYYTPDIYTVHSTLQISTLKISTLKISTAHSRLICSPPPTARRLY